MKKIDPKTSHQVLHVFDYVDSREPLRQGKAQVLGRLWGEISRILDWSKLENTSLIARSTRSCYGGWDVRIING